NPDFKADGVAVVNDLDAAIKKAAEADVKEAFIIGGGEIFTEALPRVDRIYLTRVHASFEGDAFFPRIDSSDWKLCSNKDFETDEKHAYRYSFQVWDRMA
ncbi:MAG: dihydrofolate reductase, partial [Chitinophagaceae bacterium]